MAKHKKVGYRITAKDETNVAIKSAKKRLKGLGKTTLGVKSAFGALVGAMALKSVVTTIVEFENLEASLVTVTGSSEAATEAFKGIKEFAKTTPFQVTQLTDAFIKMKALGLDPSESALTSYGNTASAMGKSLNQMIEAVADAATGEFERLKEFGIRSKSQGDKVTFTFNNVSTTIGKNSREIEGYLKNIGGTKFAGAMEKRMDTLGGSFSNLQDTAAQLAESLGKAGLSDVLKSISESLIAMEPAISAMVTAFVELQKLSGDFGKNIFNFFNSDKAVQSSAMLIATLESEIEVSERRLGVAGRLVAKETSWWETKSRKLRQVVEFNKELTILNDLNDRLIETQITVSNQKDAGSSGLVGKSAEEKAIEAAAAETIKLNALNVVRFEDDMKNIERLNTFLATQEESEKLAFSREQGRIEIAFNNEFITENKRKNLLQRLEAKHQKKLSEITKKGLNDRQKFQALSSTMQVKTVIGSLLQMTSGVARSNKTMFETNKIAGIGNAIINTAVGVSKAISTYPPPLSFAMAAAQLAAGMAQVAAIKSTSFGSSGAPSLGGTGGGAAPPISTIPIAPQVSNPVVPIVNSQQDASSVSSSPTIFNVDITGNPTGEQVSDLLELFEDRTNDNVQFNITQSA